MATKNTKRHKEKSATFRVFLCFSWPLTTTWQCSRLLNPQTSYLEIPCWILDIQMTQIRGLTPTARLVFQTLLGRTFVLSVAADCADFSQSGVPTYAFLMSKAW